MTLDLDLVASFVALTEDRHFGRAAQRLHLSTPALTKRLHRLERQVGAELVVRGPAGFAGLTPAGARFVREATPLLAQADVAREAARSAAGGRGLVRLGVPGRLGEYPTPEDLRQVAASLRRRHPRARLWCVGVPYADLTRTLVGGLVDVVWTAGPSGDPALDSTPLAPMERVGVVSFRHELAEATSVSTDDFVGLPMLRDPQAPPDWMRLWFLGDVRREAIADLRDVHAGDLRAVIAHVGRGTHVTVMHSRAVAALPPALSTVALDDVPPVQFHAVRRRADRRDTVRSLVGSVREVASARPG